VVGTQNAPAVFEVLLVQVDGLVESARGFVGGGEVVAGPQDVRMVGAKNTSPVSEALFEQVDGLVEPARGVVGAGEVIAGGQGVGMVGPQDARTAGQRAGAQDSPRLS